MTSTIRRNFSLTSETSDTVDRISQNSGIKKSEFVERAIQYYVKNEGKDYKGLYEVLNSMFGHIEDKINIIDESINKNTSAVNDVKKDSNTILECWNDKLFESNKDEFISTDERKNIHIKNIEEKFNKELNKKRKRKVNK